MRSGRETMHGMDTASLDELRVLRARAYGPQADIDQDPAALRRLHELETLHSATVSAAPATPREPAVAPVVGAAEPARAATPSPPAPGAAESAAPAGEPTSAEPSALPRDDSSADVVPSGKPRKRRISRAVAVLWALSVVAAAALAAGVTYATTSMAPVSTSSGAPQIATLESTSLIELPSGWFGAGPSSRVFEFYGLTLFESSQGYGFDGTGCFTVVATEQLPADPSAADAWTMNTPVYSGCRVGDFPATVQFSIGSNAPQELRDRYPDGSSLQFVFDGDRIGVFLDSE